MKSRFFPSSLAALSLFLLAPHALATESGGGVGLQLLGNTDLVQYELRIRELLPHATKLAGRFAVSSAVEVSLGVVRESDVANSELGRFAVIPELLVDLHPRLQLLAGLGAGFMGGDGEFTRHDLGGPFFLASKFGCRLPVTATWGLEMLYYHQSNGGLYEHNASLNMPMIGVYYSP